MPDGLKNHKIIRQFLSPPRLGDKVDKVEGILAESPEAAIRFAQQKLDNKQGTYQVVR